MTASLPGPVFEMENEMAADRFANEVAISWDGDKEARFQVVNDKADDVACVGEKIRVGIYKLVEVVDVTAKTVVSRRKVGSKR